MQTDSSTFNRPGWCAYADGSYQDAYGHWAAVVYDPSGRIAKTAFVGGECRDSHTAEVNAVLLAAKTLDGCAGGAGVIITDSLSVAQAANWQFAIRHKVIWLPREQNQVAHVLAAHGVQGSRAIMTIPVTFDFGILERQPSASRPLWGSEDEDGPEESLPTPWSTTSVSSRLLTPDRPRILTPSAPPSGSIDTRLRRPRNPEQHVRSALSERVAQAFAEGSDMVLLAPLIDEIEVDHPSAAAYFSRRESILQSMATLPDIRHRKYWLAEWDNSPICVLHDGETAAARLQEWFNAHGVDIGGHLSAPIDLKSWINTHFRCIAKKEIKLHGSSGVLTLDCCGNSHGHDYPKYYVRNSEAVQDRHQIIEEIARLPQEFTRVALGLEPVVNGAPEKIAHVVLTLSEAWALLGVEPHWGQILAARGEVRIVREGIHEYVIAEDVIRCLDDREQVIADMEVTLWDAAAILGTSREFVDWLKTHGHLSDVNVGDSSRHANKPCFRRGDVRALLPRLTELLRAYARATENDEPQNFMAAIARYMDQSRAPMSAHELYIALRTAYPVVLADTPEKKFWDALACAIFLRRVSVLPSGMIVHGRYTGEPVLDPYRALDLVCPRSSP